MSLELNLYGLRLLGLPVNKIISRDPLCFSRTISIALLEERERARAIFWDDAGLWLHPPPIHETWALYGWRLFISREAPLQ